MRTDELDRPALGPQPHRLAASGVAGLYINGGTGDAANLTQDERLETAALLVPRLLAAGKLTRASARPTSAGRRAGAANRCAGAERHREHPAKKDWPDMRGYYRALAAAGFSDRLLHPRRDGHERRACRSCACCWTSQSGGHQNERRNIFLLHGVCREYQEKWCILVSTGMLVPGLLYGADGCIGTWMNLLPDYMQKCTPRAGQAEPTVKPPCDSMILQPSAGTTASLDTFENDARRGATPAVFPPPVGMGAGWLPAARRCWRAPARLETLAAALLSPPLSSQERPYGMQIPGTEHTA